MAHFRNIVCLIHDTRFRRVFSLSVIILAHDEINVDDLFMSLYVKSKSLKEFYFGGREMSSIKDKVKCTLVQVLRLCTGRTAHSESRGIVLIFLEHDTRRR